MKEVIFIFLFALVVGSAINGFAGAGGAGSANPSPQEQQASGGTQGTTDAVAETSDATWNADVVQSQTPVLVYFYAEWCGPCKQMAPIVSKLAANYQGKVKFLRVDIDKNPSVTGQNNVQSIPTFLIFNGGKLVDSYNGAVPEGLLKGAVDKTLG
jgi:thioredoxin 1